MHAAAITLLSLLWLGFGIKTWGFLLNLICPTKEKMIARYNVVLSGFISIVFWPLVYFVLALSILQVVLKYTFTEIKEDIYNYWYN